MGELSALDTSVGGVDGREALGLMELALEECCDSVLATFCDELSTGPPSQLAQNSVGGEDLERMRGTFEHFVQMLSLNIWV